MKSGELHQGLLLGVSGGLGLCLLIASWAFIYIFLLVWTERALAPWDTIHTHEPPLGTLPRILNDFFEWRGSHVPSVLVAFGGLGATAFRFIRKEMRIAILWQALLFNVLFLLAHFPVYFLAVGLDNLWSMATSKTLLEPRFSFSHFVLSCGLWLGYLAVQGFGFGFLRHRKTG